MSDFPCQAARNAGRSTIAVKTSRNSIGADGAQSASCKPRHVENEAMRAIAAQADTGELRALHIRLLELERIATQPERYPYERRRPARALYGISCWRWIGGQLGLSWREVKAWLEDIDDVLTARIRAGLE